MEEKIAGEFARDHTFQVQVQVTTSTQRIDDVLSLLYFAKPHSYTTDEHH